jgi:hypothetical protein
MFRDHDGFDALRRSVEQGTGEINSHLSDLQTMLGIAESHAQSSDTDSRAVASMAMTVESTVTSYLQMATDYVHEAVRALQDLY